MLGFVEKWPTYHITKNSLFADISPYGWHRCVWKWGTWWYYDDKPADFACFPRIFRYTFHIYISVYIELILFNSNYIYNHIQLYIYIYSCLLLGCWSWGFSRWPSQPQEIFLLRCLDDARYSWQAYGSFQILPSCGMSQKPKHRIFREFLGKSWVMDDLDIPIAGWFIYNGKSYSNGWWLGVPPFQETL